LCAVMRSRGDLGDIGVQAIEMMASATTECAQVGFVDRWFGDWFHRCVAARCGSALFVLTGQCFLAIGSNSFWRLAASREWRNQY
jgi:hypothetical protein